MKQIIALGGGGFSMEPENLALDRYILNQAKTPSPSICFIPTASGDSQNYIDRFYKSYQQLDCKPSHLSLFNPPTRDLEDFLLSKDILFVGGGNTKNLLALWKEWHLDIYIKKAWEQGVILSGLSAGSICWFEQGVTDSFGDGLEPIEALGFLPGSHCPHYDGEINRRPAFQKFIQEKTLKNGIAADDGVAIHYIDQAIHTIVSSRKEARAYTVTFTDYLDESVLIPTYLDQTISQ
ncbi:peptidase E [Mangrovibacillus cuniculi]|uniref:Peptidase E n=1 Tax=Mangrovibacillus cuniculi TaxID=2593652 RepID=A0A7S8C9U0_9BACI|nr:peptidase E [Mangrovibacillus cuniculi]QPC45911.1 peptidase E [Mangrovibacillus cuniculi]